MEEIKQPTSDEEQLVELGKMLGQPRAFGMVAGRCSAAHAECLRKIRDEKLYLKFAPNWGEYCKHHLKIPKRTANHTIALLEKHSTLFFDTSALAGISEKEFERIKPAINKEGIHAGGEVIALIPENAERAIEAVARLQAEANAAAHAKPAASVEKQIAELERRGQQVCDGFQKTAPIANGQELQHVIWSTRKVQEMVNGLASMFR